MPQSLSSLVIFYLKSSGKLLVTLKLPLYFQSLSGSLDKALYLIIQLLYETYADQVLQKGIEAHKVTHEADQYTAILKANPKSDAILIWVYWLLVLVKMRKLCRSLRLL